MDQIKNLEAAVRESRKHFDQTITNAEIVLENRRNEYRRQVDESAAKIAALESELELYDALEQERRAALVRMEIAHAIENHHVVVDRARKLTTEAFADFARAFACAGTAFAAGFAAKTSCGN